MLGYLKKKIINATLRKKFLALTVLISIIPIAFIGYFSYWISESYLQESIIESSILNFQLINLKLDRYLSNIDNLSVEIIANKDVQQLLLNKDINNRYVYENETKKLLRTILSTKKHIHSIVIYDQYGDTRIFESNVTPLGTDINRFTRKNIQSYEIYKHVKELKGNRIWAKIIKDTNMISMIRNLNELGSQKQLGTIVVNLYEEDLKGLVEDPKIQGSSGTQENWSFVILEQYGNVVYEKRDKSLSLETFKEIHDSSGHKVVEINGKKYLSAFYTSMFNDWKMILLMPTSTLFSGLNIIKKTTILLIFICLVLLVFFLFLMSSYLTKPITKLSNLMKQAELGNMDVKFDSHYKDEIGELGRNFNSMLQRIKKLISQNHEKQKKLRTQELEVLQMQINPHFLYNTIDTINWMAQSIDADKISEVSIALATYYRQSLSKGAEIIKVSDEISQVNSYLVIQKTRYEGHINFKIDIDKDITELYIPKLTFQPIVENSIYHGLREKKEGGIVEIYGEVIDNKVMFKIKDNGKGMDNITLDNLIKGINGGVSSEGYGLSNVNERLKLYFGKEYGLKVESVEDCYTTVTVEIPRVINPDLYTSFQ